MSNEEDECDSSSLFTVASQLDVNSFLHSQAAKITGVTSSLSDDEDSSMDGSLLARFTQIPSGKTFSRVNCKSQSTPMKPYLSRSCFASLPSSSPIKSSSAKTYASDDLTELKWLNTFKLKELKDDFNSNAIKDKDGTERNSSSSTQLQEQSNNNNSNNTNNNNDEDLLAKLISELKSHDSENTKINTTSFGILIFHALYSKRDEKHLSWSLTIKQLYEYTQLNAKQISSKRGWKNLLRQALLTIPCFVKTKRDLLKSRSLWTIDPYYRPLLTKAYLTSPPTPSAVVSNKTLSEAATNRSNDQLDTNPSSQSVVSNFAPKATVKTKVLPRLYERLCEEKVNEDDHDGDEADSSHLGKRHRSLTTGRKRPRSSSTSGPRRSMKDNDGKRRSSTSPWTAKLLKRHKRRHQQYSDVEPKTSTPNKGSNVEAHPSTLSTVVTPCPSVDHTYLIQPEKGQHSLKKQASMERIKSPGSLEYNDPSSSESEEAEEEEDDEDDERDSSSAVRPMRKSIITTRAQAAARSHSKNRRKTSPPKKRSSLPLPPHRPNTRINRRIIEHDLKLLRQANVLPPLSPPTNQLPLDLSLAPHRSSSFEDVIEKAANLETVEDIIQRKTTPSCEGVLDLSLSR